MTYRQIGSTSISAAMRVYLAQKLEAEARCVDELIASEGRAPLLGKLLVVGIWSNPVAAGSGSGIVTTQTATTALRQPAVRSADCYIMQRTCHASQQVDGPACRAMTMHQAQ